MMHTKTTAQLQDMQTQAEHLRHELASQQMRAQLAEGEITVERFQRKQAERLLRALLAAWDACSGSASAEAWERLHTGFAAAKRLFGEEEARHG